MATTKNDKKVAFASNGKAYILNPHTGTAKRVNGYNTDFVLNNEVDELPKEEAFNNTKILHSFVRKEFPEAKLSRGHVEVCGYRIKYCSHGFMVQDLRNDSSVNINEYNNDFPTPEQVLTFVMENATRPLPKDKPVNKEMVTRGELLKLAKSTERKEAKETKDNTELRLWKDIKQIVTGFLKSKFGIRALKDKLKVRVPVEIKAEVIKECVLLEQGGSINKFQNKVVPMVHAYVVDYNERKKIAAVEKEIRDKKKIMGKFLRPELEIPMFPKRVGDDLQYELRGPSTKRYLVTRTINQHFANVLLHHFPKAAGFMNSVLRGEIREWDATKIKFTGDSYTHPDKRLLEKTAHSELFRVFCIDIFRHEGIPTIFNYKYNKAYKKGDNVRMFASDVLQWWYGKVVSNPGEPIQVRLEDGEIIFVYKHQMLEKI